MSLIHKSAYVEVCSKCGQHAAIVLIGGRRVEGLSSKQRLLTMITMMLAFRDVSREEYMVLVEQTAECKLPVSSSAPQLSCEEEEEPKATPAPAPKPMRLTPTFGLQQYAGKPN